MIASVTEPGPKCEGQFQIRLSVVSWARPRAAARRNPGTTGEVRRHIMADDSLRSRVRQIEKVASFRGRNSTIRRQFESLSRSSHQRLLPEHIIPMMIRSRSEADTVPSVKARPVAESEYGTTVGEGEIFISKSGA
eukprot:767424-Hanusia_phi.AAC.1